MPHRTNPLPTNSNASAASVDALDLYLNRVGKHARLTPDQERAALRRLAALRAERWRALVSSPAFVPAIFDWLERNAPADLPRDAMRRAREAGGRGEAMDAFVDAIARVDAGRSDRLCAPVVRLRDGDTSAFPLAPDPSVDLDLDREAYVQRVRDADAAYKQARNRFLCANLRLVVNIAGGFANNWMPLADRVQEGNLGLLKAVERFDVERGTRFSTYAVWWVRHYITQALIKRGRKIRIPAHLHRVFMKARRVEPALRSTLGRKPTHAEVGREIGVDPEKVADADRAMTLRGVGLDSPIDPEGKRTVADTLQAEPMLDVDRAIDDERHIALASTALAELDDRPYDILRRRFGLDGEKPWTLRKLGERYSVSRERIRQLQNKALLNLREAILPGNAVASA